VWRLVEDILQKTEAGIRDVDLLWFPDANTPKPVNQAAVVGFTTNLTGPSASRLPSVVYVSISLTRGGCFVFEQIAPDVKGRQTAEFLVLFGCDQAHEIAD
jgi:hypothetical protein